MCVGYNHTVDVLYLSNGERYGQSGFRFGLYMKNYTDYIYSMSWFSVVIEMRVVSFDMTSPMVKVIYLEMLETYGVNYPG